jgi:hypothetical protein
MGGGEGRRLQINFLLFFFFSSANFSICLQEYEKDLDRWNRSPISDDRWPRVSHLSRGEGWGGREGQADRGGKPEVSSLGWKSVDEIKSKRLICLTADKSGRGGGRGAGGGNPYLIIWRTETESRMGFHTFRLDVDKTTESSLVECQRLLEGESGSRLAKEFIKGCAGNLRDSLR